MFVVKSDHEVKYTNQVYFFNESLQLAYNALSL